MFERRRRHSSGLNATAMADLSFMLLVFFLLTSSMDTERGLPRQLPPAAEQEAEPLRVESRNVLTVRLTAGDSFVVGGDSLSARQLTDRVRRFVAGSDGEGPEMSQRDVNLMGVRQVSDRHVISIEADGNASYDAYFHLQNALTSAYLALRDDLARQAFGHALAQCSPEELEALAVVYPQRISEQPIAQATENEEKE